MTHAVRWMVALTLVVGLAACSAGRVATQPVSSDVRAVLNAEGEIVAHQAFRADTRRWYDASVTNGSGHVLTPRGQRNYRRDRWRQTVGR